MQQQQQKTDRDTQPALWRDPHGEELRLGGKSQHQLANHESEPPGAEVGLPAPVKPSDDAAWVSILLQPHKRS